MLHLFNTKTRQKEPFSPIDPKWVKMYSCGPTVYDFAHIGNFRAFVLADLLKRYLRYSGYQVLHVMNITDVEDKIIRRLQEDSISLEQLTQTYEEHFHTELKMLNIEPADVYPKATEHVEEMIELIGRLLERGLAYKRDGSVYYSIGRFAPYGELAHLDKSGMRDGISVDADEYDKENARDFVLWKARSVADGKVYWPSPFGEGRPGWHLECSCMSMKYLGESFDIHTGGVDLIFPHHQNEVAQSEGATGKPFVRYWIHNEMLNVNDEKMSKSKGNFYRLNEIGTTPEELQAYRYILVVNHYRHRMNFSLEHLDSAKSALRRLSRLRTRLGELTGERSGADESAYGATRAGTDWNEEVVKAKGAFCDCMDDDLNTPAAMAAVFGLVGQAEKGLNEQTICAEDGGAVIRFFDDVDQVLGVFYGTPTDADNGHRADLPNALQTMLKERENARTARDWGEADRLRDELLKAGIEVRDTPEGAEWSWVK